MREDCCHYETRTYDDDREVARFCTLGLAPEQPWRCPDNCARYERILMIGRDFQMGALADTPEVEEEPEGDAADIAALLADAETIVGAAEEEVLHDLRGRKKRRWWQRRGRGDGDDGDDFRLSSR